MAHPFMRNGIDLTSDKLRSLLHLPQDADTSATFSELGIDSWDFIEFRATLETSFGISFSDESWLSLKCPNDVLQTK